MFIIGFAFSIFACGGENKSDSKEEKKSDNKQEEAVVDEDEAAYKLRMDDYAYSIDTSFENYTSKSSLPFFNNDVKVEFQSFFHYDSDGALKVVEEYNNDENGQDILRWYYKDDQIVYLTSVHVDYKDDANWRQKTYYIENNEVKFCDEFKDMEGEGTPIDTKEFPNTETAVNMMELQGEYGITFSGFIEQQEGVFLVVSALKDGYTSALVVDQAGADDFIKDLYDNKKDHMEKRIIVNWEPVVDPSNGMKQNAYRGGSFVK